MWVTLQQLLYCLAAAAAAQTEYKILSENTNCSLCLKRKLVNLQENTTVMFVKFSERTFQEAGQFSKVDKRQFIRK